jgi:hypothetical protein
MARQDRRLIKLHGFSFSGGREKGDEEITADIAPVVIMNFHDQDRQCVVTPPYELWVSLVGQILRCAQDVYCLPTSTPLDGLHIVSSRTWLDPLAKAIESFSTGHDVT